MVLAKDKNFERSHVFLQGAANRKRAIVANIFHKLWNGRKFRESAKNCRKMLIKSQPEIDRKTMRKRFWSKRQILKYCPSCVKYHNFDHYCGVLLHFHFKNIFQTLFSCFRIDDLTDFCNQSENSKLVTWPFSD